MIKEDDSILDSGHIFNLNLISDILLRRQRTFLLAYMTLDNNFICRSVVSFVGELTSLYSLIDSGT
jgi:hypothetical protein